MPEANGRRAIIVAALIIAAVLLALVISLIMLFGGGSENPPFAGMENFVVCIDAGHGGTDPGATDPAETRYEKDDNLALALAVCDILVRSDIEVVMTRDADTALTLDERCEIANDSGATLFVSLHRNSGGGTGVEVWIASEADEADKMLGKAILDRIAAAGVNNNRGLRKGTAANPETDYAVIRGTGMPSCIVEMGFMDSDSDNDVFDTNLSAYAAAIAEGIMSLIQ